MSSWIHQFGWHDSELLTLVLVWLIVLTILVVMSMVRHE